MARTALTITNITRAGVTDAGVAGITDGHMFDNTGHEFLEITNGNAAARTVTVVTPRTVEGLAVGDQVVSIPNGQTRKIGPFPRETFSQPRGAGADAGKVYLDYEATFHALFTTRVFRLPEL
jgi:hypothetical protein